jgi:Asp-tRNA(Asn)/Glu-tRNA(Gln) amidotransferase A subunit family amidase
MPAELTALTMRDAARLVRERAVSPVELTRACIDRIREHDALTLLTLQLLPRVIRWIAISSRRATNVRRRLPQR